MDGSRSARFVEARLRDGREVRIVHRGQSMVPALRDGDRLRVAPLDREAAPGEIVLARRGPRLVAHRLVAREAGRAITRGDACAADDPPLAESLLVGRVV